MLSDTFYARVDNKCHVFIRTESRFFDITDCRVLTDGTSIDDNDGLVLEAGQVPAQYVADLVDKSAKANVRRSNIKRFQKEDVI